MYIGTYRYLAEEGKWQMNERTGMNTLRRGGGVCK